MKPLQPLPFSDYSQLETPKVWKSLRNAHRYLAEFKGLCASLPNPSILIDTLSLQEAKESSEIENIITTHNEVYAAQSSTTDTFSVATKEVAHYAAALKIGYEQVQQSGLIRLSTIIAIQEKLEQNDAGLRKLPGTTLKNESTGATVYQPPQSKVEIEVLMTNLVDFIHLEDDLDPLLHMAIAHHQFESIHPFYDGNGRTGRILNILILIREGLLDLPLLYLSRYINRTKPEYYRLLQSVRDNGNWEDWCCYILDGVTETSINAIALLSEFRLLMQDYKTRIRSVLPKIYSQDLLNNLFRYPYTKIDFLEKELTISRPTATKYLEALHQAKFLEKEKIGRSHFFINRPLFKLLTRQ